MGIPCVNVPLLSVLNIDYLCSQNSAFPEKRGRHLQCAALVLYQVLCFVVNVS